MPFERRRNESPCTISDDPLNLSVAYVAATISCIRWVKQNLLHVLDASCLMKQPVIFSSAKMFSLSSVVEIRYALWSNGSTTIKRAGISRKQYSMPCAIFNLALLIMIYSLQLGVRMLLECRICWKALSVLSGKPLCPITTAK